MKVRDLIAQLSEQDLDAEVGIVFDGADRMDTVVLWKARSGRVLLSDGDVVYHTEDRPNSAPSEEADKYWRAETLLT